MTKYINYSSNLGADGAFFRVISERLSDLWSLDEV
jgi:hypothetical protein